MKPESVLKFKMLFEKQKKDLLAMHGRGIAEPEFQIPKDETLDDADLTAIELSNSMGMRLKNREMLFLRKIDEALGRIEAGTFGECDGCGEEIDPRRMEARPTTTMCLNCKEAAERKEYLHIDGHKHKSIGSKLRLA